MAFAVIERWLDVRKKLKIDGRHPIFCTLKGKPIKTAHVRALLPRLSKKAGIEKRVHAHGLRHTLAAQLAGEKVPINVIQSQLGHSNAATTSRYLQHIAPQELIETMRARTWKQ
ncbi:MAG: tyrosine-type recombinase/integrase [Planctomycetota bacterium]